jgi:hypothetical protein
MTRFSIARPSKIYPNWEFWYENKPSGNPEQQSQKEENSGKSGPRKTLFFSSKSYHPLTWRDSISRPPRWQAETIPLDHAVRAASENPCCSTGISDTVPLFLASGFITIWTRNLCHHLPTLPPEHLGLSLILPFYICRHTLLRLKP